MRVSQANHRWAEQKIEDVEQSGAKSLDLRDLLDPNGLGFEGVMTSLSKLTQLEVLGLGGNGLTAVPDVVSRLRGLTALHLSRNDLAVLPEWLGELSQLQSVDVSGNALRALPESLRRLRLLKHLDISGNLFATLPPWLDQLTELESLFAFTNGLTALPESFVHLSRLTDLNLANNPQLTLPEWLGRLASLNGLSLGGNELVSVPEWICHLKHLRLLDLQDNQLTSIPDWIGELGELRTLFLNNNPLTPDLKAICKEGTDAVLRYLRARADGQITLNEAKLILIGEGEVGKSCLLGALRGDPWQERRDTTHGIDIKTVKVTDPTTGTEMTLNGWDFGGQRVYRPTHQLFFSAPAVYLVVWKPREGPQQGFVKEWIKLVKYREPDAKILVVATHGGPGGRQPDIDRHDLWETFGKETVIDFFHVDSREGVGINEVKDAIARVAASLPEMGRKVPKPWQEARRALAAHPETYLRLDRVFEICKAHHVDEEDARLLLRISRRVGDLVHYEHDPALHDIVVLKPDWLATAMSFVLDDKQTRDSHGLVSFARLSQLWNDQTRPAEFRYDTRLHPLFLRLMERFDLSYKVALPTDPTDEAGFWLRIGRLFSRFGETTPASVIRYTSLIAQLVPDVRPDETDFRRAWPVVAEDGDEQQTQICRIVDARNGQTASAEGLFYQLIVRLHRFSLGRENFMDSVHWQRGLVLDDDYNGRALLEQVGNDLRITVRAPYPEKFLSVLTHEVEWLVETFWDGLRCDVMVPCIEPCGRNAPGTGLFEVKQLIESKRHKRLEYPCHACSEWLDIDALLRNAPAARTDSVASALANFQSMRDELAAIRPLLLTQHGALMERLEVHEARVLSKVDDAFASLMRTLTDEAKDGPRLFSLAPVDRSAFNPSGWVKKRFRITLWCEHSRLPLPLLNKHDREGVYEIDITREWLAKAAPFLKVLTSTLTLVLPVAASATKLAYDEATFKTFEDQLDFGKACAESMIEATGDTTAWLEEKDEPAIRRLGGISAHSGVLREFQAWLKKEDPSFGGLCRVLNRRQEFLWVHRSFQKEY